MVSDIAGGLTHGVASKANIYGIALEGGINNEDDYPTEYPTEYPPNKIQPTNNDYPTDDTSEYPSGDTSEYPSVDTSEYPSVDTSEYPSVDTYEYLYDDTFEYLSGYYPEYPSDYYTDEPIPAEFPSENPSDGVNGIDENTSKLNISFISNILASLKYIDDNMLRPNKAVINLSIGTYLSNYAKADQYIIDYWRDYIDHMSSRGAVFVVAAGNETNEVELDGKTSSYPCAFDNVGAIDNAGINAIDGVKNELLSLLDLREKKGESEELNQKINEIYGIYINEYMKFSDIYSKKDMNPEYYKVASY
eukprot:jgi/Orpsp1_1/1187871/evm.model.d7180000060818.2